MHEKQQEFMFAIIAGRLICPMPPQWNQFYKRFDVMLLSKQIAVAKENRVPLPIPTILTGWASTNDYEKNQRLQEQLHVLRSFGLLEEAIDYLMSVEIGKWKMSFVDLDPNLKSNLEIICADWEMSERLVRLFAGSGIDDHPDTSSLRASRYRHSKDN